MATSRLLDRFKGEHPSEGGESARRSPSVPLTRASRMAVPLLAGVVLLGIPREGKTGAATVDTSTMNPIGLTFVNVTGDEAPITISFCTDSGGTEYYYFVSDDVGTGVGTVYYSEVATEVPTAVTELMADDILRIQVSKDCSMMWVTESGAGDFEYTYASGTWTLTDAGDMEAYDEVNDMFYWVDRTDSYYEEDIYNEDGVVSGADTTAEERHPNPYGDQLIFDADGAIKLLDMSSGSTPTTLDSSGDIYGTRYQPYPGGTYSGHTVFTLCDGAGSYDGCDPYYWEATTAADGDDDGSGSDVDCDDTDASIYPGATETAGDGIDSDCDGEDDPATTDTTTCYADSDGDGYGDPSDAEEDVEECSSGYVEDDTDCDDTNANVNPGETEVPYDGDDNDCDDSTPDDDLDGDGFEIALDCDDDDPSINPGETETCDGVDTNCSGDEFDATDADTWHEDSDGDTYGDPSSSTESCTQPSGYVADDTDCDDTDAATHPDASEICDGYDNDCDGTTPLDEQDSDTDGWMECEGDCDDSRDDVNPDEAEQCDDVDHDCDGTTDNDVEDQTWYQDSDGDGYGDDLTATVDCAQPGSDYITQGGDCDDTSAAVNPNEEDIAYDGVDQDCDGSDYEPDTYWTDCDLAEATSKGATVVYLVVPTGLGDDYICEVKYLLAEEGDDGEIPNSYLTAGSSLDVGYDSDSSSGTPNPYYVNHLYEGTTIETDTHDSDTDVLEAVQDADGNYYVFGREGCVSALHVGEDGIVDGSVVEPTITLNFQDGSYEDVYREHLEEKMRFEEPVDFQLDLEDGEVTIVESETGDPDTGDTAEDTGKKDTGETPDPPGDCGEGCSIASAPNPDLGRVMGGTGLLATIALGTALTRRRQTKDGQTVAETDGYHWDN